MLSLAAFVEGWAPAGPGVVGAGQTARPHDAAVEP